METLIKDLKRLKEKIILLIDKKISTEKFDKWITTQILRNHLDEYYEDLISEIGTRLELLRVKFLESIKWRKTNEDRTNYKKITYPKEYLNKISEKIDLKIKSIKNAK